MSTRRVVITGMGAITPLGNSVPAYWDGLINGKSGSALITHFDAENFRTRFACEVKGFDPGSLIEKAELKRMDRFTQFGMMASHEALTDSGIDLETTNRERFGVLIGSGIGGMETFEEQHTKLLNKGPKRISPLFIPMMISDILSGMVSMRWKLHGPNFGVVSACATSSHAIGTSLMMIQRGMADVMLTGGAEASITPMAVGGFNSLQAMSTRNDEYETASRPFDVSRDGFVIGEGSGVLMLEELEHARARGASIHGELVGLGFSADAYNMVAPAPGGTGAQLAMRMALSDAGVDPDNIAHINTHGTATPTGDISEIQAIRAVFGEHAPELAINSTKSMTGHLLGAAGGIEAIATIMAAKTGQVPPTINLRDQDPECNLPIVSQTGHKQDVPYALSNTFGFGGHNATLVIKRWDE